MTKYDHKVNLYLSYLWLVVAVTAIVGVFLKGAWHQIIFAAISVLMFFVMRPKRWIHIPKDVYEDLNMQITRIMSDMIEGTRTVIADTKNGDIEIVVAVEINVRVSHGNTFNNKSRGLASLLLTETTYSGSLDILGVIVKDDRGCVYDSDFDNDKIQLEYDLTDWE